MTIKIMRLVRTWLGSRKRPVTSPAHAAEDYIGTVTGVADGDTFYIKVENMKARYGVDSPERGEPGYGTALAAVIEGKQVHCLQVGLGERLATADPRRSAATALCPNVSSATSASRPRWSGCGRSVIGRIFQMDTV